MLSQKPRPVAEHEAQGDTSRIYHEIRQTLRVSGVNLNFRTWAGFHEFFPTMWAAMQPVAASQAFESASDRLRARAADLALALPALEVRSPLGASQRYQVEAALALYHYVNPKLLLFTVLVHRGMTGEQPKPGAASDTSLGPRVPFGAPPAMAAMEMVDDPPSDARLRRLFRDIRRTLGLSTINSDYRTLALWPDYLDAAWGTLGPSVQTAAYAEASAAVGAAAASLAERFPIPTSLDHRRLRARGETIDALMDTTAGFERLLPSLIMNIALLLRDVRPDGLHASPFPIAQTADSAQEPS